MGVNGETTKRQRSSTEVDRLSSLHDDILIAILSNLPLHLAIAIGSLSRRWRGLWENIISIDITHRKSEYLSNFYYNLNSLMMQFTSPFIHNFSVELLLSDKRWSPQHGDYTWLRQICHLNVRKLKLTRQNSQFVLTKVPSFIFETQSLVSIELDTTFDWRVPKNSDMINLPNLKSLSLAYFPEECEYLKKLIEACPSLEELSLTCQTFVSYSNHVKFSNQNLRRLVVNLNCSLTDKVEINAPKLEYLHVRTPIMVAVRFDKEPIVLREVIIEITSDVGESKLIQEFFEAIRKVRILSLDIFALDSVSTVFHNAAWITINMKLCRDIQRAWVLLKWCPRLEFLTLKFSDMSEEEICPFQENCANLNVLPPVIKRIAIETYWYDYYDPRESFLRLVDYLLSNTIGLEHFRLKIEEDDTDCIKGSVRCQITSELKLCKLLYQCPTVSPACEVEFVGNYLRMSRKAGPKVWRENGEIIPFSCSPWDGFKF